MEPIEFDKNIEINPIYLDSNIKNNIVKIIQDLKICSEKDGYVTEICDIKNIESIGISRHTNFPIFRVRFKAFTLKPEAGKEYLCKILNIGEYGVTLEHFNAPLVIIVPFNYVNNYNIERQELLYEDKILKVGDMVWVVLQECKYSCKKFMSIAYLRGCPPPTYQDKKKIEKTTPLKVTPQKEIDDQSKPKKISKKDTINEKSPSIYKSSPTLVKNKLGKKYKF